MFWQTQLASASLTGVLAHQLIFIHGEWHLRTSYIILGHGLGLLLLLCVEIGARDILDFRAIESATALAAAYLLSLYTSIGLYRLLFHRLRGFPGPIVASVIKFWHVWLCRNSQNHLVLDSLRHKYGDIVRTGQKISID